MHKTGAYISKSSFKNSRDKQQNQDVPGTIHLVFLHQLQAVREYLLAPVTQKTNKQTDVWFQPF